MKIYLYLFIFILAGAFQVSGNNVVFRANVPNTVIKGQTFRVEFTVNDAEAKNFRGPSFGDLEVKFGPTSSVSMSTQNLNGRVTASSSLTFTYIVLASKEGSFSIPPATVSVDGKSYSSNALTVKVLPPDKNVPQGSSSNMPSQGGLGNSAATSQTISSEDLFVRAILSKQSGYEQEAFLLTYKLFSRYERTATDGTNTKFPDYEGFMTQEIELPPNKSWQMENLNGRNYATVVLRQLLIFPQRDGVLTIAPAKIGAVVGVYVPRSSNNPFSAPTGGIQEVRKTLTTGAVTVNAKALPSGKPVSFSGALGDFTMTSSLTPEKLRANEPVTLKLTFRGTGNIKLMKNPEVKFPADFETYDPKVDNDFKTTTSGMTGTKTIEYLAIPRHQGDFVIPSIEFSYFDLKTQTYKTVKTPEYKIHVEKAAPGSGGVVNNYTDKESLKFLNEDIRYIKTDNSKIKQQDDFIFGSWSYYLWYLIPLLSAIALFILFRKQARENANLALVRTKKANKVAGKRLKKANIYMKENKKEEFYDEVLKALWGYLSDKLNIPVSELSKDNVEAELTKYGVAEELITDFMDILNICEFARYAPVDDNNSMDKIYRRTTAAIGGMENTIKKRIN